MLFDAIFCMALATIEEAKIKERKKEMGIENTLNEMQIALSRLRLRVNELENAKPTKKNKLVSDETRENHLRNTGIPFPEERASGRTTAEAIYYLGFAMRNPGTKVRVTTNHGRDTRFEQRNLLELIACYARTLELKHFTFDGNAMTVTYDVFG